MKKAEIALLPGDGIGPEITAAAVKALRAVGKRENISFSFTEYPFGGCSIDACGTPVTDETMAALKNADAILLGAVGGPKWDSVPPEVRPEKALLRVRKELGLFANLRPTRLFPALCDASPLKLSQAEQGIDLLIVRELTGGIYFGNRHTENGVATDEMTYSKEEIERIARVAFDAARHRRGKLCSVDKANVLDCSRLWRKTLDAVHSDYPDVTLEHLYVDNCAMQLILHPDAFDTVVTENMFGDILSDEASVLSGSIGMMPSASLGEETRGMYEPIHGSAPDLAGKDAANPIGAILSGAMLLRYSLREETAAVRVENAVERVLQSSVRTSDIARAKEDVILVGTAEMGDRIAEAILQM